MDSSRSFTAPTSCAFCGHPLPLSKDGGHIAAWRASDGRLFCGEILRLQRRRSVLAPRTPSDQRSCRMTVKCTGQNGPNAALSGPQRTVANYVPHATTIFDYTRRAIAMAAAEIAQ